jgi:hypothetical protein
MDSSTITKVSIRNAQKDCQISSTFSYGHHLEISSQKNAGCSQMAEYQGTIYISNKILSIR